MEIILNGTTHSVPDHISVAKLLESLQTPAERVVVEVNVRILKRAEHGSTLLHEGDQVEIVRFVGGGAGERQSPCQ